MSYNARIVENGDIQPVYVAFKGPNV